MDYGVKLAKKQTIYLLSVLGGIILIISLESMMHIKDITLFDQWYKAFEVDHMGIDKADAFSVYVTGQLSLYFFRIVVPMILGIHTYFAYVKLRVSKLFVFIWSVLLIGALLYRLAHKDFTSVFYYLNILGYGAAILGIWSLIPRISEQENK